jgi:tRNA nucleotidyltransferase (CCA-adding enzyme)
VTAELLERVARSDHFGRTTPEALAREFPAGDEFLARVRELAIEKSAPRDIVLGRHLIARGMRPGRDFGAILERCREVQDETGWTDPEQILERVLELSPR